MTDDAGATAGEALVQSIRELISTVRIVDFDALDAATLEAMAASIATTSSELQPHVVAGSRGQFSLRLPDKMDRPPPGLDPDPVDGSVVMPYSPVIGKLNPVAPPVRIVLDGDEAVGSATFDAPYNGPPDSVHGGILAAVFDEVLGAACFLQGLGAFTGTLTIRYRQTTPLGEPIRFRGRVTQVEDRKIFASGEATSEDGATLYAEAEGIFIRPREAV